MESLSLRVKSFCLENGLIEQGEKILAGISGGRDSVCLFYVLKELMKELSFELFAVHVEHGIRGESSKADEMFVRELCKKEGVPLLVYNEKAADHAKENSLSLEEAARLLRYRDYERAVNATGASKVALAHHMNDQAETFLFNLVRGSSLRGLSGMSEKRRLGEGGAFIIRPLLNTSRQEIEDYIRTRGLPFVEDESNKDIYYSRNRIREQILPELLMVGDGALYHIARSAEIIGEAEDYIEKNAGELFGETVKRSERDGIPRLVIDIPGLKKGEKILRSYVVRQALKELTKSLKDVTALHTQAILGLLDKQSGRMVSLPYGLKAFRSGEELIITFEGSKESALTGSATEGEATGNLEEGIRLISLKEPLKTGEESGIVLSGKGVISLKVLDYEASMGFPENCYTKWVDYDKINADIYIRTRRQGDFIALKSNGSGDSFSTQSLKKFFINTKIPREDRDDILLIAEGDEIVWVVGSRLSERYKINKDTKRVLEIKYETEVEK